MRPINDEKDVYARSSCGTLVCNITNLAASTISSCIVEYTYN